MVLPISCNECRRRKIRCDRVQPCKNCSNKSIPCTYPSKFRSIEINKLNPTTNAETSMGVEYYKSKIKELETKLAISEDLISIFDSTGNSCTKYFGENSIPSLESEMMNGILPFEKDITREINMKKKPLPVIIDDDDERNKKVIKSLVEFFFKVDQYYYFNEIIDKDDLLKFLDNYDTMKTWSNDEDMMLLCCILVDVLKNGLENREPPIIPNQEQKLKYLINYYFQISKIQTTETKKFLQSQLILINYYYFIYSFEKCWKLVFQLVSNAYSIGLHIEGGPLWTKINTMEALVCSASSRPNIIPSCCLFSEVQKSNDELKEYQFCEVLRIKNGLFVSSYINETKICYQEILKIDKQYDQYNRFLESKIIKNIDEDEVEVSKKNEKIYILLLMSLATQLKIHYEFFETQEFSDAKILDLCTRFINILNNFVYGKLNTLRDKFSALECFFYQFLLIFSRYLNFKTVETMMKSGPVNGNVQFNSSLSKILNTSSTTQGDENFKVLIRLRDKLLGIIGKNSLKNERIMKVLDVIKSVNSFGLDSTAFIKTSNDNYLTEELKELLEDPVYDVLKSITDHPNMDSNSNFIDNKYTMI